MRVVSKRSKGTDTRKGRPSIFAGKRLYRAVPVNPRKPGSLGFKSFELIPFSSDGISYEEYRKKGGRTNDLAWDLRHHYVLVGTDALEAARSASRI